MGNFKLSLKKAQKAQKEVVKEGVGQKVPAAQHPKRA